MSERAAPLILGCTGAELTREEARLFAEIRPWGFILFARNVESPAQVRALTGALRRAAGHEAPIFIDQEGGRVARLGPPHWRAWAPPLDEAERLGPRAVRALYLRYRIIAAELADCGIDGNCAPVVDLATPETHPVLYNRCLGAAPGQVAARARAAAEGLLEGGVLPVIKHMPGHGPARVDSHAELPRVSAPAEALRGHDFRAFEAVADLPIAMTAHVVYEAFDTDAPATTSARMIRLIREEIGFGGLLMSDDISMGALEGPVSARAQAALRAGCDMILHCNGDAAEMRALGSVAGRLEGAALARARRALGWRRPARAIDIGALEAEFRALTQSKGAG